MNELHVPLLELTVLLPLLGAALARGRGPSTARGVSLVATGCSFFTAVGAWIDLVAVRSFEAHDGATFLGWLPGGDPFAIDELSAPLLPLAALQFFLTVLATLRTKSARFSFSTTLVHLSCVLAILATKSPAWLAVFLVAATVPPGFELVRRGESVRAYAAHMGLFAALLIAGVLLQLRSPGSVVASCLLSSAVLVRSGVAPLHCWMPDLFQRASFGTAILTTTPLLGHYAALRYVLPTAPDALLRGIAIAALVTAVYTAGLALVERDARRFFAYLLLSQSSLVLLGLELTTTLGLTGALCVWLSVGLAMTGFGITLRCVEGRVGRLDLDRFNGLHDASPTLAGLFLLTGLASIGFPGTVGFIALEILLEGASHMAPAMGVLVLLATALSGVAVMRAYSCVFTGARHTGTIDLRVRPRERVAVLVLAVLILGGGVAPQLGVASRQHAAEALLSQRAATVGGTPSPRSAHPHKTVPAARLRD